MKKTKVFVDGIYAGELQEIEKSKRYRPTKTTVDKTYRRLLSFTAPAPKLYRAPL